VIQQQGSGFSLDQNRAAYLRYLRREQRQSTRSEADAALIAAETEMLQLHLMEKKRELIRRADFDEAIDSIAGIVLGHLSGLAARCSNDLTVRRKIDAVVFEVRKEMATAALRRPMNAASRRSISRAEDCLPRLSCGRHAIHRYLSGRDSRSGSARRVGCFDIRQGRRQFDREMSPSAGGVV
jgi:hypothetical protein